MISYFTDLLGGWKELRSFQGYSYQISRSGKRRAVPVDNYGRRGAIDHEWVATGTFGDELLHKRFRNYALPIPRPRAVSRHRVLQSA